ncbi:MAG: glycosyltransferase family 39 protein [Lentisphaeria bacterium]
MHPKATASPLPGRQPGAAPGRRFLFWLGLIALAALLLRLGVCWELRGQPAMAAPGNGTDMATYRQIAESLLRGHWPSSFYYQPFYYAVFLPLALLAAGGSVWGPALAQCLLGAGSVWFTGLVAARLGGRRAGLLAAAFLTLARHHVFCTPFLLLEVLQGFWLALFAWLALRAWDRNRSRDWLWAGLCLAAAILTRGSALLLLPGLLALLAWRRWPRPIPAGATTRVGATLLEKGAPQAPSQNFCSFCGFRRPPHAQTTTETAGRPAESAKDAKRFGGGFGNRLSSKGGSQQGFRLGVLIGLLLLMVWLPQLPFSLTNWHHHGRWTGPSTAQDAVLALGNTPEAPPGGLEYTAAFQEWMRQSDRPAPDRVPVSRQMLHWLAAEPLAWPELKLRMLLLFWNPLEIPNNVVLERDGAASRLLQLPVLPDFGIIGALGLAGLLAALGRCRRSPPAAFMVYAVLTGMTGVVLFYILARFRVPLLPGLAVFAGLALDRAMRLVRGVLDRRPNWRPWPALRFTLLLAACYAFCLYAYPLYATWLEAPAAAWTRPHGVQLLTHGGALIHDHGPLALGGWRPLQLPVDGVRLTKSYEVTPAAANHRLAGIELSLLAPQGGRLKVSARFQGRPATATANGPVTLSLKPGNRPQPVRLALGAFDPAWKKVRVDLELTPVGDAVVCLFVDVRRNYGRSVAAVGPGGTAATLPAEACPELFLLPAAPPIPAPVGPPVPGQN